MSAGFVLIDAGVSDYDAVYATQLALVEKRKKAEVSYDYLVLVEHPDVYTYGRKNRENQQELEGFGNVFSIERGGEVTFHNPGQLVAYPILGLQDEERDIHKHLRRLESVLIDVLADFELPGERREGLTGVWIHGKEKKIASIGVAASSWVTYHGCALNVSNDLTGFTKIRPCGLASDVMTSMQTELGETCPSMDNVKDSFLRHFSRHFERYLMV